MGFCRTNLFKRLESSGQAFLQSVERHILRNFVYLHAIENDLPLPIGTQDAELLDARFDDDDDADLFGDDDDDDERRREPHGRSPSADRERFPAAVPPRSTPTTPAASSGGSTGCGPACSCQQLAEGPARRRRRPCSKILKQCGDWDPASDAKLDALSNC